MTIRATVLMVSTVLVFTVAGTASSSAQPMVLGLEADLLHRTGRVAVSGLSGKGEGIVGAASIAQRSETRVQSGPGAAPPKALVRISLRDDRDLAFQYGSAFTASVERCRLDVARRLGVALGEVAAGTLTLHWTLEPSGRVQDVSVFAWSPTDEGVMACAEMVVASRSLPSMVHAPVALEWTYAFRKLSAVPAKVVAQERLR
jgi:hypothetical protein